LLKICVEFNEKLATGSDVGSEILSRWPGVSVISSVAEYIPSGTEGLLIVGEGGNRSKESLLLVEKINAVGLSQEQVMFQVDANLGRMTVSDLIKTKASTKPFDRNVEYSRRDLFSGIRSMGNRLQTYTNAPVIYSSICEAKYGCTKCIQTCPTQALSIVDGSVILKEEVCSRVGLCTAVCPVSAIQLPRYSESQFLGLVSGITRTHPAIPKTLVLTCNKKLVSPEPWMFVEQVKDIGVIGTRHLAIAASSGIDKIIVYCADGVCSGKATATQAVQSIRSLIGEHADGSETIIVRFLEGEGGLEEIKIIQNIPSREKAKTLFVPGRDTWENYIGALRPIASPQGSTLGLGLATLNISNSCTLCQVCENYCPHSALQVVSGSLEFDSSKCTGCGYCAKICPEHSITLVQLERISDLESHSVFQDAIVNCARCKKPLGSATYLKTVKRLLGKEDPMMNYCNACKQQIAVEKMFGNKR
jgi:Fe-S-cluster-containing hydrogenase component 2